MNNSSQIEIAKALKVIKLVSTQEQLDAIINIFSNDDQDCHYFKNAINGLSEEDEFALLTKLMGAATCIIGLEQRPIIDGDYVTPDFLVTFKPNCTIHRRTNAEFSEYSCFVEVKSTKSDKYKIGGSRLRKIRNTADRYSLPLIIAIRFVRFRDHALWALIEDDRSKTSFNVTYNDCIQGVRHILWDEYSILLNPTLTLVAEYSIDSMENTVSHSTYGRQNKLILRTSENEVFIEDKHLQILYSVFFECFWPEYYRYKKDRY